MEEVEKKKKKISVKDIIAIVSLIVQFIKNIIIPFFQGAFKRFVDECIALVRDIRKTIEEDD